jgi:molybdenum cofactor biosynthesis protein B
VEEKAMSRRAYVITISDRASDGEMPDESGPALVEMLAGAGFETSLPELVPDEQDQIIDAIAAAVVGGAALVVTTGGTGLGPRDVTPQATSRLIDYEVPGLAEQMRRVGAASTPLAALSRGLVGVRGRTLILNVPGSVKGARQSLEAVLPVLGHATQLLSGDTKHEP